MPSLLIIALFVVAALAILGWIITDTMRIKHGRPTIDGAGPGVAPEKLLDLKHENDALRAQLDQVYDRLETLERIVTDKPTRLAEEIDKLGELPPRPERTPPHEDRNAR